MSYQVRVTAAAQRDMEDIWRYIAQDHPHKAEQFTNKLEQHIQTLETFPERCPIIPENNFLETNYRHLLHKNYRIIFAVRKKVVYIVRVIHGARLWLV